MQKNISCFQVLEELYEENIDNQNLKQIVFDIAILKKYLHYWQKYYLLKEIQDMFLPRRFRGNTDCGFIEDYTSEDEIKKWNSVAVKGTTKFVLSLVFQETKGEEETIITFSTLKKSRGLAIEPRNYAQIASERIPLKVIKEAFMNL